MLTETVPLELLTETVPLELLTETVPLELLTETVPLELLAETVPLELLTETVPLELLTETVPLELLTELRLHLHDIRLRKDDRFLHRHKLASTQAYCYTAQKVHVVTRRKICPKMGSS